MWIIRNGGSHSNQANSSLRTERRKAMETKTFEEQVREAWRDPYAVGAIAMDELIKHGMPLEDQASYNMKVGILAGRTEVEGPTSFIERFEKEILAPMIQAK